MTPKNPTTAKRRPASAASDARLLRLPLRESDGAVVAAVRAGRESSHEEFVRRYGGDVERILYRVLGPDPEIEDLAHDVFVVAFLSLDKLRDPQAVRSWLVGIAIRKARKLIARRKRWSFIRSVAPGRLPEIPAPTSSAEVSDALRTTYLLLAELPVDDRIAFALRQVDGMELGDVAEVTRVSLATAKRRISRARSRFVQLAKKNEVLAPWVIDEEEEEP